MMLFLLGNLFSCTRRHCETRSKTSCFSPHCSAKGEWAIALSVSLPFVFLSFCLAVCRICFCSRHSGLRLFEFLQRNSWLSERGGRPKEKQTNRPKKKRNLKKECVRDIFLDHTVAAAWRSVDLLRRRANSNLRQHLTMGNTKPQGLHLKLEECEDEYDSRIPKKTMCSCLCLASQTRCVCVAVY